MTRHYILIRTASLSIVSAAKDLNLLTYMGWYGSII